MTSEMPTRGQLERTLSQSIQALYRNRLGQRPEKVTCQFFDEKLAIVLEQVTTPAEQFLLQTERQAFAQEMRSQLEAALKPQLTTLIEEIMGVPICVLLWETDLTHGYTGIVVILKELPPIRDPQSIPKFRREKREADPPQE